jgi:hypothetical protein
MDKELLPVRAISVSGYRSFGPTNQSFEKFSKINLFIGQNNSGKSNILRLLHDVYPLMTTSPRKLKLEALDRHMPGSVPFTLGIPVSLRKEGNGDLAEFFSHINPLFSANNKHAFETGELLRVFQEKAANDGTIDAWFDFVSNLTLSVL